MILLPTNLVNYFPVQAQIAVQDRVRRKHYRKSLTTCITLEDHPYAVNTLQFLTAVHGQILHARLLARVHAQILNAQIPQAARSEIVICIDDLPVSGNILNKRNKM